MKVSKIPGLGNYGIYIDGLDFETMSDDEWMEVGRLHLKSLVTIVRNTNCTKDSMVKYMKLFGESRYTVKGLMVNRYKKPWAELVEDSIAGKKYLRKRDLQTLRALAQFQVKTAEGRGVSLVAGGYSADGSPKGLFADGELLWHSNESGTTTFTPGVMLLGHKNVVGSSTGFVTTPDYYESVSESFRSELDDMIIEHKFTPGKINPGLNRAQDYNMENNMCPADNDLPLVIQSPGGIRGLHYSINTVHGIKGMKRAESNRLFAHINKGLFTDEYTYDHWYKNNGDLLLFDNTITLHRRLGNIEGRECYRIPFDYTNLQTGPYIPYFQEPYRTRYIHDIQQSVRLGGIENFKMPYTGLGNRIAVWAGRMLDRIL